MADYNLTQPVTTDISSLEPSKKMRLMPLLGLLSPIGVVIATLLWIKHQRRLASITLLISVLSFAGYIYIYSTTHKTQPTTKPQTYVYKLAQNANTAEDQANGATFSIPTQFRPVDSNPKINAEYKHQIYNNGRSVTAGEVRSLVIQIPEKELATNLSIAKTAFNSASQDNKNVTLQFTTFIKSSLAPTYKPELSQASPLQTDNIKSNAWLFDFTATDPAPSGLPPMKGKLIYAFGKSAVYYFIVAAEQDNWASNATVWTQVINSLKIDQ